MLITRNCDNCGKQYEADSRNVKRGWGLCCSKSCAAYKREKSRPDYNPERVKENNVRRENWNGSLLQKSLGDKSFVDSGERYRGRTSEGYRIYGNTAYDEFGEAMYTVDLNDDTHPFSEDAFN